MNPTLVITKVLGLISLTNGSYGLWKCWGTVSGAVNNGISILSAIAFILLGAYLLIRTYRSFKSITGDPVLVGLVGFKAAMLTVTNITKVGFQQTIILNLLYWAAFVYLLTLFFKGRKKGAASSDHS